MKAGISVVLIVMNRFLKIGIVVSFAAMPFVLPSNSVDFHFMWTLSSGLFDAYEYHSFK